MNYISLSYGGALYSRATIHKSISDVIPDADVSIATLWETASIVARYGKGAKAYFCQHHEALFFENEMERADVNATYFYGLNIMANSSWLKSRLERVLSSAGIDAKIRLTPNAIDLSVFSPLNSPKKKTRLSKLKIISYGGRDARWKGFLDMAKGIKIARQTLSNITIEWNVYGECLLPPNNCIANYNHLGFLSQEKLAEIYREHDVLVSASWYESFPLFPLEAMASGLAVITTSYGAEDYAVNNENCLIVPPRDAQSIADAIIKLYLDVGLMERISSCAVKTAKNHGWGNSASLMEEALADMISKREKVAQQSRDE